MAFRSRRSRISRARPRRAFGSRARTRRSRTSRMYKSTRNHASFKSQGLPRELAVKFPFYSERPLVNTQSAVNRVVILGNSLDPTPAALQGPTSTPPSSQTVTLGDVLVPGHSEYTGFYGVSQVMGSAWTIQFTNLFGEGPESAPVSLANRVVALVCPYQLRPGTTPANQPAFLLERIEELDSMRFEDLCAQPYAKVYNLNSPESGHETRIIKIYRRTKSLIGVKDMKDRLSVSSETLPVAVGNVLPSEGWFIYLRMAPLPGGLVQGVVAMTIRGQVYAHLTSRAPLALESAASLP